MAGKKPLKAKYPRIYVPCLASRVSPPWCGRGSEVGLRGRPPIQSVGRVESKAIDRCCMPSSTKALRAEIQRLRVENSKLAQEVTYWRLRYLELQAAAHPGLPPQKSGVPEAVASARKPTLLFIEFPDRLGR